MFCFFTHIHWVILMLPLFHAPRKGLETYEKVDLYHEKSRPDEIFFIYNTLNIFNMHNDIM